ncbi:MAG: cobaltochelatase subunit CobN [Caulobacteraceae bacterium]
MHLLFKERRGLDEADTANDLGQTPADLVLLSFFDADLGAAAQAWSAWPDAPTLRLANLGKLRHPMSVDLYAEQVVANAKAVLVHLHGGLDYWPYGAEELSALCRTRGIPLALLAGDKDGRPDERLIALSTVPAETLADFEAYLREGGPDNLGAALRLAASLANLAPPPSTGPTALAACGVLHLAEEILADSGRPLAVVVFYRSHFVSGDTAPVEALAEALTARGLRTLVLYVSSLKAPDAAAQIADMLAREQPAVVLNLTGFSARGAGGSPLDAANAPVLQVALAGSDAQAWRDSTRGLSPADMAMQVVLPELDGRLSTTTIAFKAAAERVEALQFDRIVHQADADQVALVADRAVGWTRLAATPAAQRTLAIVLSEYPGAEGRSGQIGRAIGLDAMASLDAIAIDLGAAGYDVGRAQPSEAPLQPAPIMSLADYGRLFAALPPAVQTRVTAAWGLAEADPAVSDGAFILPIRRCGRLIIAVQPDRGAAVDRKASYHDPDLPPRHAYVAAYLWLQQVEGVHAMIHLGAHGTLEWLPGKALAPAPDCFPTALIGGAPVIYPYIVNNPGEAAAAKRRLGAVTLGHMTPPLRSAGAHGAAAEVERLIDDYAAADGLDRRRTALLKREILDRADAAGLLSESGGDAAVDEDDALARLDAYLCDVKDLQIRDGLHIFGRPPAPERRAVLLETLAAASPQSDPTKLAQSLDACAQGERAALLAALDGRFVPPGPAGAPSRGRPDVLPTGRNLFAVDPHAIPTRAALALARKAAEALLRRRLQDEGDWLRRLVLDLWGSTTLRTGGEDLALVLLLMGVEPVWDQESNRVTGIEVTPLAVLGRPRVDVTLRISGLFRDAFEGQIALFDLAVRTLAARDEPHEDNPLAAAAAGLAGEALRDATSRIYGPAPGAYGAGVADAVMRDSLVSPAALGQDYLAAGAYAYGQDLGGRRDPAGFAARVGGAQALVHTQDHDEIDLLDGLDFVAAEGGFAAAAQALGGRPALYHADTSKPEAPRLRSLTEEVARVVRGRAANPVWIKGMMRHGYSGAAEIGMSLEALFGFASTVPARFDGQFDLIFDATFGDVEVEAFLASANPDARRAMLQRFRTALARDLWRPRRNSVAALLEDDAR